MKLIALAVAVTSVSGLAGCAASRTPSEFSMEPDLAKIKAIDHQSRVQGVQVVWINVPVKAVRIAGS